MRMTNAEYHANPAIGSSMLKAFDRSPRHCWQLYFDPDRETPEPSKAFLLGSAIHAATLEPETFGERYAVAPVCDRRTNTRYKNQERNWSWIKERNRRPIRTSETAAEYPKLPKERRD